jgi:hypothetical protein
MVVKIAINAPITSSIIPISASLFFESPVIGLVKVLDCSVMTLATEEAILALIA